MSIRPLGIPAPSLRRLPIYYRRLRQALDRGTEIVSSKDLGESAGVPDAQVRKDLSYLELDGRPGVGYNARSLAADLEDFLGLVNDKEAVLVGAGNLGMALALYPGFERYGLHIVALFDSDPARHGALPDGRQILPVEKLTGLVSRLQVRIGIITAPEGVAQGVADALVAGGIQVIWNFAPCKLRVPADVLVKNEDLAAELATLSHHISRRKISPAGACADARPDVG
jgi:redox-sensing transcriptional repressor